MFDVGAMILCLNPHVDSCNCLYKMFVMWSKRREDSKESFWKLKFVYKNNKHSYVEYKLLLLRKATLGWLRRDREVM